MKKKARSRSKADKAKGSGKARQASIRKVSRVLKKLLKRTRKLHSRQKVLKRQDKALHRQNKALSARIGGVEGKASELLLRITQLQTANRGLLESISRASEEGVASPSRLDRVESWLAAEEAESGRLWQKVDSLDGKAEDYADRLEAIEQSLSSINVSLQELKFQVDKAPEERGFVNELRQRIDKVEKLYGELSEKGLGPTVAVEAAPGQTGDRPPEQPGAPSATDEVTEQRLQSLDEDVAGLKQGGESLLREFNDLSARFEDMVGRAGAGEKLEPSLESRIADIESRDLDLSAQTDLQGKHLEEINGRARELEERISSLSQPATPEDGISAEVLLEQSRMLENRVTDMAADLDELGRKLDESKSMQQKQLEQLASEVNEEKLRTTEVSDLFDGLSRRLEETAGTSGEQSEQYLRFEQGIKDLEAARREFITRLDQHESQIQDTVSRAQELEKKVGKSAELHIPLQALEESQDELKQKLSGDMEELDQKLRSLTADLQEQPANLNRLRNFLAIVLMVLVIIGAGGYWFGSQRIEMRFTENDKQIEEFGRHLIAQDAQLKEWAMQRADMASQTAAASGIAPEEWDRLKSDLELQKKVLSRQVAIHEEYRENFGSIQRDLGKTRVALDEYVERQKEFHEVTRRLSKQLEKRSPAGAKKQGMADPGGGLKDSNWLRQRNPGHYTIQLAGAYGEGVLEGIAGRLSLPGPVAVYQRDWNGRVWNVLVYGDFSSKREAQNAMESLPEEVKEAKPWIRSLSRVQADLEGD